MTEANKQAAGPLGLASTAELSLVERLRQRQMVNWVDRPDPLCQEAAAELVRLAGQHEAFGRWIVDALKVLDTIDPDDMEESEQLLALIKAGEMLTLAALAPKMLHKLKSATGPACNLKTPWLAPDEA